MNNEQRPNSDPSSLPPLQARPPATTPSLGISQQKTTKFVILLDYSRELPAVDGNRREPFISLGCAAENLGLQASVSILRLSLLDGSSIVSPPGKRPSMVAADSDFKPPISTNAKPTVRWITAAWIPESSLQTIPLQPSADSIKIHLFDRQSETFNL